jgi:hypothetical protein
VTLINTFTYNYKLWVLQLVILILRITPASMLVVLALAHSANSKLKVLWCTEIMVCCEIFLNETFFFVNFTTEWTRRTTLDLTGSASLTG